MRPKRKLPLSYIVVFFVSLFVFLLMKQPASRRQIVPAASGVYRSNTLQTVHVSELIDGDTLCVQMRDPSSGRAISIMLNIFGVAAPSLHAKNGQIQPPGQTARDYLESLISPETNVKIDLKGRDASGRPVAVFLGEDDRDVACVLLEAGWVKATLPESDASSARYLEAQRNAQAARSGIWR